MANFTNEDLKNGVIKGTDKSDLIEIDAPKDKKITIKAGKGNDEIDVSQYYKDLYIYAGMGSDTLSGSQGTNYLFGESGANTFEVSEKQNNIISAGKGKAIIKTSYFVLVYS